MCDALKTVILIWIICRLFPDWIESISGPKANGEQLSLREWTLTVIVNLSLLYYATDFRHSISSA